MPRVRFTLRRMMAAVAILSVVLAIEKMLFSLACDTTHRREGLADREAIDVWLGFNVVLLWLVLMGIVLRRVITERSRIPLDPPRP